MSTPLPPNVPTDPFAAWKAAWTPRAGVFLVALVLVAGTFRWITCSQFLDQIDVVFFVRGVSRYSVLEGRPHFPGYPVFIWAARLARIVVRDPLRALHAVAVVSSTLTAVPIALFVAALRVEHGGTSREGRVAGLVAGGAWLAAPGSWVTGTEAFSDPLGLLLATAVLFSVWRGASGRLAWTIVAGVLSGLTAGARLAYVALLGPFTNLVLSRDGDRVRVRVPAIVAAAAGAVPWLAWQFWMDGWGLVLAGQQHVGGHFRGWGESALTDVAPWSRPFRLLRTVVVHGLGAGGSALEPLGVVAAVVVLALAVLGISRLARSGGSARWLFVLWAVPYALYATFAHDVEYPRYILPVLAAVCALVGLGLPTGRVGPAMGVGTVALLLAVTIPLALEHGRVPPTEFRLAEYMAGLPSNRVALLVSDERNMVSAFVAERAPGVAIMALGDDQVAERTAELERGGRVVYSMVPDSRQPDEWTAVARFCRNAIFDPRSLPELWLFRHGPPRPPGRLPECGEVLAP